MKRIKYCQHCDKEMEDGSHPKCNEKAQIEFEKYKKTHCTECDRPYSLKEGKQKKTHVVDGLANRVEQLHKELEDIKKDNEELRDKFTAVYELEKSNSMTSKFIKSMDKYLKEMK